MPKAFGSDPTARRYHIYDSRGPRNCTFLYNAELHSGRRTVSLVPKSRHRLDEGCPADADVGCCELFRVIPALTHERVVNSGVLATVYRISYDRIVE